MLIVLIPGLMNDAWVWRHQIGALSRIAPVVVANNDGADRLDAMARRILETTAGRLAVVGHSMGGRVALEVAAAAPGRVAKLALIATGAGARAEGSAGAGEEAGRLALVELAEARGMAAVARQWLPPMLGAAGRANEGLVAGIEAMLSRCPPAAFAAQQRALLARPDRTALLPTLGMPLLTLAGAEDAWSPPAQLAAIAAAAPVGRAEVVPDAGHMLLVEKPDAVTALLMEFLAG